MLALSNKRLFSLLYWLIPKSPIENIRKKKQQQHLSICSYSIHHTYRHITIPNTLNYSIFYLFFCYWRRCKIRTFQKLEVAENPNGSNLWESTVLIMWSSAMETQMLWFFLCLPYKTQCISFHLCDTRHLLNMSSPRAKKIIQNTLSLCMYSTKAEVIYLVELAN